MSDVPEQAQPSDSPAQAPDTPELLGVAQAMHEEGFSVVPFILTWNEKKQQYDKDNIGLWKKWETEPQTDEEFNALSWSKNGSAANAIGVVLGTKAKNGFYLSAIDYDTKPISKHDNETDDQFILRQKQQQEAIAKGKEILRDLPVTRIDETVNKGLHHYFWSKNKVGTDSTLHDIAALELLGEKKICLMAPSFGYRNIGSDVVTVVEDIEKKFYDALKKHGLAKEEKRDQQEENDCDLTFSIASIVDLSKLRKDGDDYYGSHPVHDSSTENNFHVNVKKNVCHCFRHNSGGGPLQFLAVLEGIIKCEDMQKGALRGKKFLKVVEMAKVRGLLPKDAFQEEEKESHADKLVNLCLAQNAELFVDDYKNPYIRITEPLRNCAINDVSRTFSAELNNIERERVVEKFSGTSNIAQFRNVVYPLRNKLFKMWLANLFWSAENKAVGNEALSSAVNVLTGKALSEGRQYKLYNRVAPAENGGIYLDMTDDAWRVIKITAEGWEVVNNPPILFRRYNHQNSLVMPEKVTLEDARKNIQLLFKFVNLKKDDEENKLMFLCNVISFLIPDPPHPAIIAYGPQGSAKSWLFRIIRKTIDPSALELLSLPRDDGELMQQLNHHWCAFYDNITSVPSWASDVLCRAVTGGGNSKRELYSDDDDTIYTMKRCIGLNGINIAARKGDLFERSNLIEVERIPDEERKTERELNEAFDKEKALILGSILAILSEALKVYSTTKVKLANPRMADFNEYACAISVALGKTSEEFSNIYKKKIAQQNEETINSEPVALAFLGFCQKYFEKDLDGNPEHENWSGTPTELLEQVTQHAQSIGIKTIDPKHFPSSANPFMRKINDCIVSFQALGYEVTHKNGTPRQVVINLGKQTQLPVVPVITKTEKTSRDRYCSDECANYDKPSCTGPNWQALNKKSLIPFDCKGYKYLAAEEEYS